MRGAPTAAWSAVAASCDSVKDVLAIRAASVLLRDADASVLAAVSDVAVDCSPMSPLHRLLLVHARNVVCAQSVRRGQWRSQRLVLPSAPTEWPSSTAFIPVGKYVVGVAPDRWAVFEDRGPEVVAIPHLVELDAPVSSFLVWRDKFFACIVRSLLVVVDLGEPVDLPAILHSNCSGGLLDCPTRDGFRVHLPSGCLWVRITEHQPFGFHAECAAECGRRRRRCRYRRWPLWLVAARRWQRAAGAASCRESAWLGWEGTGRWWRPVRREAC